MRKPVAILLLCCFALYHFGYFFAYFSVRLQIEKHWDGKIYDQSMAGIEQKIMEIPLSIPYMASEEEFRTVNFAFEKGGQYFRAIKQRYLNDTLQIVYVPDTANRSLNRVVQQWVGTVVQDELPGQMSNSILAKMAFFKDYSMPQNGFQFQAAPIAVDKEYIGLIFLPFKSMVLSVDSPPPQLLFSNQSIT